MPEGWDEEADGAWLPPRIKNPKCSVGCGVWKDRPLKKNPDYKGEWEPPLMDNPAYRVRGWLAGLGFGGLDGPCSSQVLTISFSKDLVFPQQFRFGLPCVGYWVLVVGLGRLTVVVSPIGYQVIAPVGAHV